MSSHLKKYPQAFLLLAFADGLKSLFSSKADWKPSKERDSYDRYRQTAYHLRRNGTLTISLTPAGQRFLQLTKKGEMELLMARAWLNKPAEWDGRWRIIFFDIPENAKAKRNQLRKLLRTNNFTKLQASVYISPYPLNRSAIEYLKTSGLIDFIRIGKLEELDDDSNLRKKYNL